ncbi:MAG: hypothetical protein V7L02_12700 [Nostoc sp.]|uniref:hypothetical protein n=1 Tax=Nostoc sp. TaxID=1180 RepID=UPI002FFCFAC5
MNEQRLQADYQLIESLLNCPSAEELDWAMTQNNLGAAYRNRIIRRTSREY